MNIKDMTHEERVLDYMKRYGWNNRQRSKRRFGNKQARS